MSNAITLFNNPNVQSNLQKLVNSAAAGGKPFLRFGKDGRWSWGAEDNEVGEDELFAINVVSIQMGYIAWYESKATERMAYLYDSAITKSDLPDVPTDKDQRTGKPKGWQEQNGFDLKMINGSKTEMTFKTSSQGGKAAVANLVQAIGGQMVTNPSEPIAIVRLKNTSYKHPDFGKIYKPVFEIVEWLSEDVLVAPATATPAEPPVRKALV